MKPKSYPALRCLLRASLLAIFSCASFLTQDSKADAQEERGGYGKVRGNIVFAGRPISEVTKMSVELFFKNYPGAPIINLPWEVKGSSYEIFDAPLSPFGAVVWVNANPQNELGLAGDFEAEVAFDLKEAGEVLEQDIQLTKIIHLLKPADSGGFLPGELAPHKSPVEFAWEAIPEAREYQCRILTFAGDGAESELISETTKQPTWKADLPENKEGESYKFSVEAFLGNERIGTFSVRRDAGGGLTPQDRSYQFVVGKQPLRLAQVVQKAQSIRRLQA